MEAEDYHKPAEVTPPQSEQAIVSLIVLAASMCVVLIAAYVVLFDARGL